MSTEVGYVLLIIVVALVFDFINGFHDSANSIATVVSTRVLSPGVAVLWAAFFNFLAAFIVGTAVAKTIASGIVDPAVVDANVLMAALLGAIAWNLFTWFLGLPSSSSHALIGGFGGAAVAKGGLGALILAGWKKPILAIVISPFMGAVLGLLLTVVIGWTFRNAPGALMDKIFRRLQLVSAGLFSLSHGANDAQKTMGIIVGLLVATQGLFKDATGWQHYLYLQNANAVPTWVEMMAYSAIAAGTALGGWRIVKTMGSRITKLRPFNGFCAETGGAACILVASALGVPVSTTHTITGAIVGVGSAQRVSAVRWGVAGRIVWAWVLTIPLSAAIAALCYGVLM